MSVKTEAMLIIERNWAAWTPQTRRGDMEWIQAQFPAEDKRPALFKALALLGLEDQYRLDGEPQFAAFRKWWAAHRCRPTTKGCLHSAERQPALEFVDGRITTYSPTSYDENRALEIAQDIYQRQL